jgi:peptidoglycan/xylan/chitin deacetylase (PgdA/CDA1 family)
MKGQALAKIVACACVLACAGAGVGAASISQASEPTRFVSRADTPTALAFPTPAPVRPVVADALAAPLPSMVADLGYHVPILMYHRIVPKGEAGDSLTSMILEPDLFAAQLAAIHKEGWRTVTLERLAEAMRSGTRLPARTFAITIDDGWNDGYTHAFPIMRKLGYVATFFVISSRIDSAGFLSRRQLLELQAAGNEIGNHTSHHTQLTTLGFDQAVDEIDSGSEAIARAVGHRPVSLSYPKSGVAPYVVAAAHECAGLEIAVTTAHGATESWRSRFETPRLNVDASVSPAALMAEIAAG